MNSRSSLLGLSLLASCLPEAVLAQQHVDSASGLETVVVTAQHREENIQNVPIAVTALTAEDLKTSQVRSTLDVARLIPNMTGGNNTGLGSANTYFIRGVGSGEALPSYDSSVATYVDGVFMARQNDNNFNLFDVGSVEVLRGPQGTLFGRNSSGGNVNIKMKAPAEEFGGWVEASYGRFEEKTVRGSIDIPLSDRVLTKFTGFRTESEGYVRSLTTGEKLNYTDNYGGRVDVRLLPTDSIQWDLSAHLIDAEQPGTYNEGPGDDRISLTGFSRTPGVLRNLFSGDKGDFGAQIETKSTSITSNLSFDGELGALAFITGYRTMRDDVAADYFNGPAVTGGFLIARQIEHYSFSQEVRFTSAQYDRFDYVMGLYYFKEHNRTDTGNIFTANNVPSVLNDYTFANDAEAQAIYAQLNYRFTDRLSGTLGLRYTNEDKDIETHFNENPLTPASSHFTTEDVIAAGIPVEQNTSLVTPRFVLSYKTGENSNVYASATRGFKSGGWNARSSRADAFLTFAPEKVWSYELGLRSEFPNQALRLNATAFYMMLEDFQLPAGFQSAAGVTFITRNFSDLRNYGLELDLDWEPIDGLRWLSSLGLQQADYVDVKDAILQQQAACLGGLASQCGTGIITPTGGIARPQFTPKATWINQLMYTMSFGDYEVTPSVAYQIQGERAVSTANVAGSIQETTRLLDLGIQVRPATGPWSVMLSCRNCTDETYGEGAVPPFIFKNRPGTWALTGRWDF